MHEFWYDYSKKKYNKKVNLCYIAITLLFISTMNTHVEDVEKMFGTSNYEVERPLTKGKNKLSHWLNKR